MVTIYPFAGLHPSDAAYPFVPSVPYDVISAGEAAAAQDFYFMVLSYNIRSPGKKLNVHFNN